MGNRCVITTEDHEIGIYMHWNGSPNDVATFLRYCELANYRSPETDCYGWARLCQVIGNYFDDGLSVGIDIIKRLNCENFDNGTYVIKNWSIIDREFTASTDYGRIDKHLLASIDAAQPIRILDNFGNLKGDTENGNKFYPTEI